MSCWVERSKPRYSGPVAPAAMGARMPMMSMWAVLGRSAGVRLGKRRDEPRCDAKKKKTRHGEEDGEEEDEKQGHTGRERKRASSGTERGKAFWNRKGSSLQVRVVSRTAGFGTPKFPQRKSRAEKRRRPKRLKKNRSIDQIALPALPSPPPPKTPLQELPEPAPSVPLAADRLHSALPDSPEFPLWEGWQRQGRQPRALRFSI